MWFKNRYIILKTVFLIILVVNVVLEYNNFLIYPSISFPKFKYNKALGEIDQTKLKRGELVKEIKNEMELIKPFDKRFYLFYKQKEKIELVGKEKIDKEFLKKLRLNYGTE